ncbi:MULTISPECIES: hypothetical protein [unclassified Desulfovibrio]|uniref:hypothetical protein n=1 Tax=unclassified Desulfovibrio TaxID=2593640 RepID=UPI000F5FDA3B|nr:MULTISPECIES: hypothetical protein [unclassified Desulfovibrio]RRD69349.1 hypothetical protein EII24_10400 [Desulfovibrio sp. OH1209_COT-279]RRD86056.1 hypothetical protein EII23_10400 [Desulfovibrio sp. OH1186_COT-070]
MPGKAWQSGRKKHVSQGLSAPYAGNAPIPSMQITGTHRRDIRFFDDFPQNRFEFPVVEAQISLRA